MILTAISANNRSEILAISKKLNPDWFDDFAVKVSIPTDLLVHRGVAAVLDGKIVGFLTFTSEMGKVKISWMGVDPKYHRRGVGSALVKRLQNFLNKNGIRELRVDTLSDKIPCEPYRKTRDFYGKMGFVPESFKAITSMVTGKESELVTMVKNW